MKIKSISNSFIATALIGFLPLTAYSQTESGPTPNPNGKQNSDMSTTEPPAVATDSISTTTAPTPNPNGKQTSDSKTLNDDSTGKKEAKDKSAKANSNEGSLSEDDGKFVKKAAMGGMLAVKVNELAVKKASNEEVKKCAAMMVTDHKKANKELAEIASSKNVKIPGKLNDKHQAKYDVLVGKSDAEFDKAYLKMMVAAHASDVALFEKAAAGADDQDLKNFASKTLPTLKMHKEMVDKMEVK